MPKSKAIDLLFIQESGCGQYNYPVGLPDNVDNADMLDLGQFHILLNKFRYAKDHKQVSKAKGRIIQYIRNEYRTDEMDQVGVTW